MRLDCDGRQSVEILEERDLDLDIYIYHLLFMCVFIYLGKLRRRRRPWEDYRSPNSFQAARWWVLKFYIKNSRWWVHYKTFMNFKSYRKTLSFGLFPQYISWCLSLFFTADYIILHQYLFLWYCYIGLGEKFTLVHHNVDGAAYNCFFFQSSSDFKFYTLH